MPETGPSAASEAGTTGPAENPAEQVPPPEGGSLIDDAAGLVETAVAYARQETGDLVREKIVLPTQKAGATVGMAIAIALVVFLGVGFVAVGALILLAEYVGWPAALFIVGGILIAVAGVIGYIRVRSMQE